MRRLLTMGTMVLAVLATALGSNQARHHTALAVGAPPAPRP